MYVKFFQVYFIFRFPLQQDLALQNYRNTSTEIRQRIFGGKSRGQKVLSFITKNTSKHEMTQNGLHILKTIFSCG